MKKIIKISISIICFLLVVVAAYFAGTKNLLNFDKGEVVDNADGGLELIGKSERKTVTKDEIYSELVEIKEFSTYSSEYYVSKAVDYTRYFLSDNNTNDGGIKIPGTTNSIDLSCNGIVKVGYDFDAIDIKVDNVSYKVYISLPEPKINDNYIIWDTVVCKESNCIFNPIDFDQYKSMIDDLEAEGLKDAESKGIYDKAEENIKKIIANTLTKFDGYDIVFM